MVPTGFITAKSGIENRILHKLVDEKIVSGVVSMPSNVFANTGTNVSVLFFDNARNNENVVLIDASKLGEEYKDANDLKKVRLREEEIELIVNTFRNKEKVDDFSVVVSYDEIKEKGYSLSAGQYFDIKIEYEDIDETTFISSMSEFQSQLKTLFTESRQIEDDILSLISSITLSGNDSIRNS